MDWTAIIIALLGLLSGGSVIYLIIEKKVSSPKEKVETVGDAIPLYREIRGIVADEVEKATRPLKEELDFIKRHYCCYRMECEQRIGSLEDIAKINPDDGNYQ